VRKLIFLYVLMIFLSLSTLTGCTPSNREEVNAAETETENEQMKEELEILQKENKELKEKFEHVLKENEDLYGLRNDLDIKAHQVINAIKNSDTETLKKLVSKNVTVEYNRMITKEEGQNIEYIYSFSEGDTIRQRAFFLDADRKTYISIYETIYPKSEFFNSIEFTFVLEDGEWKLRTILTGA